MEENIAKQIADLLNIRNQLTKNYDPQTILKNQNNFVFITEKGQLVACAEAKEVQWYQHEIKHVSVHEHFERKGKGHEILKLAEQKALKEKARIVQCTIREGNLSSIGLFSGNGYNKVNEFYNTKSQNTVGIWQKILI